MAITFILRGVAPHLLRYECVQDGNPGDAKTLANATILANAIVGSPLRNHWMRSGLDQGEAQQLYSWDPRSRVTMSMDVAGNSAVPPRAYAVSVDVDAGGAPVAVVVSQASQGESNALLEITFRHSTVR
jgi:hypothetical protein